jgi:hypothetical protein
MTPIILKLERDQARAVQDTFFPYIHELCRFRIKNEGNINSKLMERIVYTVFDTVAKLFSRKLNTTGNKFTFNFTEGQAITLYMFIIMVPIQQEQVWYMNLRNLIVNSLHQQILKPTNEKEPLPLQS